MVSAVPVMENDSASELTDTRGSEIVRSIDTRPVCAPVNRMETDCALPS